MARPTKYKPEFAPIAEAMCKMGATDADLADHFGVTTVTIWRWQSSFPEFCNALKAGKEEADNRVERSLYQRAIGYTYDAVKIFMPANAEEPVYAPYREHVPPDNTSMIFWLKNRRSEEWRDSKQIDQKTTYDMSNEFRQALEVLWSQRTGKLIEHEPES